MRDEQGLYKLKDDYYTNSFKKDKILAEYRGTGSEGKKGAVQYNKVRIFIFEYGRDHKMKHFAYVRGCFFVSSKCGRRFLIGPEKISLASKIFYFMAPSL